MNFWEKMKAEWNKLNKIMLGISIVGGFIFDGAVQEFHKNPAMQAVLVVLGSAVIYKAISKDLPKPTV